MPATEVISSPDIKEIDEEMKKKIAEEEQRKIQVREPKVEGRTSAVKKESSREYEIQSGDNLSKIAKRNGITVDDILAANPQITNPDVIKAGTKLILPTSKVLVRHDNSPIKSKPANDNYCPSSKGVCYGEAFGPEMPNQDFKKQVSFGEFADEVSNKLKINRQDKAVQDYIKETYLFAKSKGMFH